MPGTLRLGAALLAAALVAGAARASALEVIAPPAAFSDRAVAEEGAIKKLLERYVHAIETKDVAQFRAVKPNLSDDEERKARKAFDSLQSQAVVITVQSVDVQGDSAIVRVSRRDTINGSIVSSFPQSFTLTKSHDDWSIREIGR
jgi:hypothetical protein